MAQLKESMYRSEAQPLLTIAEHIAEIIRGEIVSSEIPPGTPIRQNHLAKRFNVSQAPVREALGQLAAEELVEYHSNKGMRVAELKKDIVREIAELRILIETDLVKRAARNFSTDNETTAKAAIEATANATSPLDQLAADNAFHTAIYRAAGQPITLEIVQRLRARYVQYLGYMWKHSDHASASLNDHKKLLKMLVAGKSNDAATFLQKHINASTNAILACMPSEE